MSVGSWSFFASAFLVMRYILLYVLDVMSNSFSFCCMLCRMMCSWSIALRVCGIFRVRAAPCLAVVGVISLCSRSMSFGVRLHTSTGLSPSIDRLSFVAILFPALAIIISSFSLVGTCMALSSGL